MHSVPASAYMVNKFIQLLKLNPCLKFSVWITLLYTLLPAMTLNNRVKVPLLLRNLLSDSISPLRPQNPCTRVRIYCGFNLCILGTKILRVTFRTDSY